MTGSAQPSPSATELPGWWNVPNALSTARLVLAVVVFGLIDGQAYLAALICFLIAVSTDWLDGYWARRFNQVTKLGRILDPFVDKIIICGALVSLVGQPGSGVGAGVATLVVARELLVTSLRAMIEGAGGDFSAKQLGKWKMVAQCAAVVVPLICLQLVEPPSWLLVTRYLVLAVAVLLTIASGLDYVLVARRMLTSGVDSGADSRS